MNISPNFVPKNPINDILSLVPIMARHRPGDKPLSEPVMVSLLMSLGLNELRLTKVVENQKGVEIITTQEHETKICLYNIPNIMAADDIGR